MIVDLALAKAQLNLTGTDDDALITLYIGAAETWLGSYIGKPLSDFDPLPADLTLAALSLVAFHYENREAAAYGASVNEVPFGVVDLARPYRQWSFSDAE